MIPPEFNEQVATVGDAIRAGIELVQSADKNKDKRPTESQLGWCIGFCDAAAQKFGYPLTESIVFGTFVLNRVFEGEGAKLVNHFMTHQPRLQTWMERGGTDFWAWIEIGAPPIPPFSADV